MGRFAFAAKFSTYGRLLRRILRRFFRLAGPLTGDRSRRTLKNSCGVNSLFDLALPKKSKDGC
jgi:hypothetical protein